jgi:putative oxidoreductase
MATALVQRLLATTAPGATILVRLMVGGVFLAEGIQKFVYADELGVGRFAKIGIPSPEIMGPFVGLVEIVCGAMVIVGLLTRLAVIPLLIDISVAILSTKAPILLGHGYWIFTLPKLPRYGFWTMVHEARTDFSMWLGLVFLFIVGAGMLSLDRRLSRTSASAAPINEKERR